MINISKKKEVLNQLKITRKQNKSIGLVPTMGSLHKGHLSLIKNAVLEHDIVWVSIFINPTQFNKSIDLENYPRNLDEDLSLLERFSKKVKVFSPSVNEIYGGDLSVTAYDFDLLDTRLEGKYRKNHFNGVATIVFKLLDLFKPKDVYFGEKDFQQVLIIKRLIVIEKFKVNLKICPTIRERNGLALSSRNMLLSTQEKNMASIIYESLIFIKTNFRNKPQYNLTKNVISSIEKIKNFKVQYLEICDCETLDPCDYKKSNTTCRAFICVEVNTVRLIDNILLN